uniref:Uncharacterized protein n=1 Tax=Anguilla anguilla TaxID=7936 RepID=A0A0E9PHS4_ANGAN
MYFRKGKPNHKAEILIFDLMK